MSAGRVGILGAGSLGSMIGGVLALAGQDVVLVTRNAAHVSAIQRAGLILRTAAEGQRRVPVAAVTSCLGQPPVDVLVVLVKSLDTATAIAAAGPMIGPGTMMLSLQNGLDTEAPIVERLGPDRVAIGRTWVGGQLEGPGAVRGTVTGRPTVLGSASPALGQQLTRLAATWTAAGLATTVAPQVAEVVWDKLVANVATAALATATGLTYGDLYAVPELARTGQAAVAEAIAVGRAAGVPLAQADPERVWHQVRAGLPDDFAPSMLQSLRAGARTEIDVINGAVCRWGARLGVPTPINDTLVAIVKGRERALLTRVDSPRSGGRPGEA